MGLIVPFLPTYRNQAGLRMLLWIDYFLHYTKICEAGQIKCSRSRSDFYILYVSMPPICPVIYYLFRTVFSCSPAALFSSDSLCTVSLCRCVMSVSLSFSLQVSFFLFIVFVVYTMLPFSMRDAIIASVLTSVSHTIVLSVCLSTTADHMEPVVWQVRGSNTQ